MIILMEIQMLKILQSQLPKMNSQRNLKNGTKMSDKIDLSWSLNVEYTFEKYDLFETLTNLCTTYCDGIDIPEESHDYSEFIIDWLEDNLKDYKEEFLSMLSLETSIDCNTNGEIDNDNITELLDNEEFIKEFRQYLCD